MLSTPIILKTHLWIDRFNSLQRQDTDEGRTHSSPVLTTSSSIKKSSSNSTSGGGEVDRVGLLIENMLNHQVLPDFGWLDFATTFWNVWVKSKVRMQGNQSIL